MKAILIAVGTELLRFGHRDTNSLWLIERLQRLGIDAVEWIQVGDDADRIAANVRRAAETSDLVLVCGGLGPTEDDRTREALGLASGCPLVREPSEVKALQALFEAHGRRLSSNNAKQADRPEGATWLANPVGSAAGIWLSLGSAWIAALPGVPAELKAMFVESLEPILLEWTRPHTRSETLRIAGRVESSLDAQLQDLYGREDVEVTILSGRGGLLLRILARGSSTAAAQQALDATLAAVRGRVGDDIYGEGEQEIVEVIGETLIRRGEWLATAESCTGGRIGFELTEVPGSSAWYRGGWIVYSNELKHQLAGISEELLIRHGAVSEPVARQLAQAVRVRCDADYGIAVTGVAGPGGGTDEKPVGTVHLALATAEEVLHWKLSLPGGRSLVRGRTSLFALDCLRRHLSGQSPFPGLH